MLKSLNIDYYPDGYNAGHTNCVDIPVAGAAGYYNYDNYFFYSFYYCVLNNWTDINVFNWLKFKNEILMKFGLVMKFHTISSSSELISYIKLKIDEQSPLLMIVKYNALFYCGAYLDENNNMDHGLLISGYDSDKRIILTRETIHVRKVNPQVRGDPLYELPLTEEMLIDIWKRSNDFFKKEESIHYNTVYSIDKMGESTIVKYGDLVNDFTQNYNINDNSLIKLIINSENLLKHLKDDLIIDFFRRIYCNSFNILFDVFEKTFQVLKRDDSIQKKEYMDFKSKYMNFRDNLISNLHAAAIRGNRLEFSKRNQIVDEILFIDNELLSIVKKMNF